MSNFSWVDFLYFFLTHHFKWKKKSFTHKKETTKIKCKKIFHHSICLISQNFFSSILSLDGNNALKIGMVKHTGNENQVTIQHKGNQGFVLQGGEGATSFWFSLCFF